MKEQFNLNSPWMQRFAMLTNLVMLNILWLICCIPVVTAGAATSALYYTIFQYHTKQDDAVLQPFFRGFRTNFQQSTVLHLPLLAVVILLTFDIVYLASRGQGTAILFLLIVAIFLVLGMMVHLFPLIARFDMDFKALLSTAFSLVVLHFPTTLLVIALTLLPAFLLALFPSQFLQFGVAWAGVWFAAIAFFFGKYLLKIWEKHLSVQQ
ncbi:MAG: YesL family protein [Oscillospiraceae bacterium]|nr:YesL family protein [Oscillospiraceae bacterium]